MEILYINPSTQPSRSVSDSYLPKPHVNELNFLALFEYNKACVLTRVRILTRHSLMRSLFFLYLLDNFSNPKISIDGFEFKLNKIRAFRDKIDNPENDISEILNDIKISQR